MPDIFRVRSLGDTAVLAPLLAQLRDAGATLSPRDPSLVLVGATTVLEAELLLLNLSPRLRRRTVIVGIDEHLDLALVPDSFTALLARTRVLGSLPSNTSPTITSFIGARGDGEGLAHLVGASFWKFGPTFHKVWHHLPEISAGAFLLCLVEAIERAGVWFEAQPARHCMEAG